ncbi:hypothetical protein BH09ACT1_BH09ACT1_26190 [soil metagenome]
MGVDRVVIRRFIVLAGFALALVVGVVNPPSAMAATAPIGAFPTWTKTAPGAFTGVFSAAAAFPSVSVTSSDTVSAIASGQSAFLGASTGFGQRFGSSRLQPYLTISSLGAVNPSVTTLTFASTTPVGWGIAFGDIDADYVTIAATGPGGALTSAELGAQDTTNVPYLNYCRNASPKPGTCGSGTIFNDAPAWCPTGVVGAPCTGKPANSVVGSGTDTAGAYDWFVPTVGIDSITLTFTPQLGLPSFQLWLVAPAAASTVTGTVALGGTPTVPTGTSVELLDSAGAAVPDIQGNPVASTVASDGTFALVTEQGSFQLQVVPPSGFAVPAPIPFTAGAADAALGTIAVQAAAVIPIPAAPTVAPGAADPTLAATGPDDLPLGLSGLALLGVGLLLTATSRRHQLRE